MYFTNINKITYSILFILIICDICGSVNEDLTLLSQVITIFCFNSTFRKTVHHYPDVTINLLVVALPVMAAIVVLDQDTTMAVTMAAMVVLDQDTTMAVTMAAMVVLDQDITMVVMATLVAMVVLDQDTTMVVTMAVLDQDPAMVPMSTLPVMGVMDQDPAMVPMSTLPVMVAMDQDTVMVAMAPLPVMVALDALLNVARKGRLKQLKLWTISSESCSRNHNLGTRIMYG